MSIHSRTARRKAQGREEHTLRMDAGIYYVWVAGSCDYAHQERCSAGAYIMQLDNKLLHTFTLGDSHATEFRMILSAMIHAMKRVPAGSDIVFLSNVSYIQQGAFRQAQSQCRPPARVPLNASQPPFHYRKAHPLPQIQHTPRGQPPGSPSHGGTEECSAQPLHPTLAAPCERRMNTNAEVIQHIILGSGTYYTDGAGCVCCRPHSAGIV